MNFKDSIAITALTLADWLDDRLTIAAIGLATGYFGFGDAQWVAISNWIVGTATLALVLIPDPRKRAKNELSPIDLVAGKDRAVRRDGAGVECGDPAADQLRQSMPSIDHPVIGGADDTYPNLPPAGYGDRD